MTESRTKITFSSTSNRTKKIEGSCHHGTSLSTMKISPGRKVGTVTIITETDQRVSKMAMLAEHLFSMMSLLCPSGKMAIMKGTEATTL